MTDLPFSFVLPFPAGVPSQVDNYIQRTLSSMRGQFLDHQAFDEMLAADDQVIYEVYEIKRPEVAGELLMGVSFIHPGKVGKEFFMTKGHFHTVLDTAEIYMCLRGEGYMVLETPGGSSHIEAFGPGKVLYVPPRWAHRSVCTSRLEDLVFFFAYPANSGHDYGTIERQGFHKLVMAGENGIEIIDNPRWGKGT